MQVSEDRRKAYLQAYEDWHQKLLDLHAVLIDGTRQAAGDQMKGLLNREARAKARFDEARLALIGVPSPDDSPFGD